MSQEGFDRLKEECVNTGLCFECGACETVCPSDAIRLKEYPWGRNPELVGPCKEESCDLCFKVCAAKEFPLSKIEERFLGRKRKAEGPESEVGVVRNVCTGYSTDSETREASASGGLVSGILTYALEEGIIDGAVLADFDPERPWIAKAAVATNREDVIRCANSKYQPHPQLLGIKDALKMNLKRIAVTATPCHAACVRKMMMYDEFRDIGGRIKLLISNICATHWSLHGTEWLIEKKMNLKLEDVAGLKYRSKPFPGGFRIKHRDGTVRKAPFVQGFLSQLRKFTPEECRVCLEKVGFVSDIIAGDTWHHPVLSPELLEKYTQEDKKKDERIEEAIKGITVAVVRSETGRGIIKEAERKGYIKTYPEPQESADRFLMDIHTLEKPLCNGPIVAARLRRGMPVREYS